MASSSDIEQQIPPPATEDAVDSSTAVNKEEPASPARSPFNLYSSTQKAWKLLVSKAPVYITMTLILAFLGAVVLVATLMSPLGIMLLFSFHKNTVNIGVNAAPSSSSSSLASIYDRSRYKEAFFHRAMFSSLSLLARSGLVLQLWLVLTFSIPGLKKSTILGSPLWKWSLLATVLISAYFVAMTIYLLPSTFKTMAIKIRCWVSNIFSRSTSHYRHPYLDLYSGFFPSATLVIYFAIVLVMWLAYFRTDDGIGHGLSTRAIEYVTWTWVSLFVGSILLLVKTILVLKWSEGAIYRRFEPRILITGIKFVYLGLTIGGFFDDQIFSELGLLDRLETENEFDNEIDVTYLQDAGRFLASLATNVTPLKEDGVPNVINFSETKITQSDEKCDVDRLMNLLEDRDDRFESRYQHIQVACGLHRIVREQCGSEEFTFDDLKKWMVDAHKNCVNMGRTLADANAMVTRLDIFISFIIWIVVVLLWLLITGIATTTVLVTIATPLLALTFIFGDTAKTFFQGIIFCFGTHAYDVGDRCIVDETELEVKIIGVLTTVFVKIGTVEKRMYPNSLLATKAIVNLGWQPDPTDVVELTLDFSTAPMELQKLETKLQKFFNDPQQRKLFERSHEVMIKEIGDKIKVSIHYIHVLNIKEMTHGECARKKNKQRSILLKKINHFLDHRGVPSDSKVLHEPVSVNLLKRRKSWS